MKKPVPGPKGRTSKPAKEGRQGHDDKRPARKKTSDAGGQEGPKPGKPVNSKRFDPKALSEESKRTAARKRAQPSSDEDDRKPARKARKEDRPDGKKPFPREERRDSDKRSRRPDDRKTGTGFRSKREDERPGGKKPFSREEGRDFDKRGRKFDDRKERGADTGFRRKEKEDEQFSPRPAKKEAPAELMTLNKYLAHSGISSRRDAAAIIKEGKVTVNGEVKKEPGYRVLPGDKVSLEGKKMEPIREMVYVLLNKPKGFITTTEDDRGRRTVMELVQSAGVDRLYPVGRLDRNTTGVLLLTNDGDLAQKLSHPKYEARKIYQVTLDKVFAKPDFDKVLAGVELEDGVAAVDKLAYLAQKNELGLEIHSGRNRIVRRIFESLGYEVEKLDRVMYAGLTKKNVPRGKWRLLTEKEVILLKHFKS